MDTGWGHFLDSPITEWLPDGRSMRVVRDFTYIDPAGVRWTTPKEVVVNGASVPRIFWRIAAPLEGKYRDASVIHDYACQSMERPWEQVHRAFYNGMRAGGVGAIKAKIMFAAVFRFGPRWIPPGTDPVTAAVIAQTMLINDDPPTEEIVKQVEAFVTANNPSLEEIENLSLEESK